MSYQLISILILYQSLSYRFDLFIIYLYYMIFSIIISHFQSLIATILILIFFLISYTQNFFIFIKLSISTMDNLFLLLKLSSLMALYHLIVHFSHLIVYLSKTFLYKLITKNECFMLIFVVFLLLFYLCNYKVISH